MLSCTQVMEVFLCCNNSHTTAQDWGVLSLPKLHPSYLSVVPQLPQDTLHTLGLTLPLMKDDSVLVPHLQQCQALKTFWLYHTVEQVSLNWSFSDNNKSIIIMLFVIIVLCFCLYTHAVCTLCNFVDLTAQWLIDISKLQCLWFSILCENLLKFKSF